MIEGQIKETEELKYESVIPVSAPDTKFQTFNTETGTWDIHADFKLIESIEELKEYAKTCKGIKVAVDTETTGLGIDDKLVNVMACRTNKYITDVKDSRIYFVIKNI